MKKAGRCRLLAVIGLFLLICLATPHAASSQTRTRVITSFDSSNQVVMAGQYTRSGLYEWLFGRHYRREWATPVMVSSLRLDTLNGGLNPYKEAGSRQSKALRLKDPDNKEYVIRTIDKSFSRGLPDIYRGTFVEDLINDQVTISHPYAAFTVPQMAEAAKIYHTSPSMAYIGKQQALKHYNGKYGNYLYLIEQRPDQNWENATNFGNPKNIISTDNMLKRLLDDNNSKVDQLLYVRCRLFDMLIGDWARHEDQWRWAVVEENNKTIFKPIPRDRDQAYSMFDGMLPRALLLVSNLEHLQSFGYTIKDVKAYGYTARFLDRQCANEVTLQQWTAIAEDLQHSLTDEVIENAVRQMPPEVFERSGAEIIAKLKSRRSNLVEYATEYYKFLAKHVDVTGTRNRDYFQVKRLNNNETSVQVYNIGNDGIKDNTPRYSRIFKTKETKDVRLYGIGGEDVLDVSGRVKRSVTIRFIGSDNKDSIVDDSWVSNGKHNTHIYDDNYNKFDITDEAKLHLSGDTSIHSYNYREFGYNKRGLVPLVYYDNPDRVFVGIGYRFARHKWRDEPFGFDQSIQLRYSLSQNAISLVYKGKFYQALGKWNLDLYANYDAVRWTNFFGLGNDTRKLNRNIRYYRLSTNEYIGSIGLSRWINGHHFVSVNGFYQGIEILKDPGKLVSEIYTPNKLFYFDHHEYIGAKAGYTFQDVDNTAIPIKGMMFYAGAGYTSNIVDASKSFATFNGILQVYIPLVSNFSLSFRTGVTSIDGTPEFYQYASVGGPFTIRGYVRDRFWGNTAFYNSNELRYIRDVHTRLMNGKAGVLVLVDDGRVWLKGEQSNTLHYGYGGGFLVAPFNKFTASVTYTQSPENGLVQLRVSRLL